MNDTERFRLIGKYRTTRFRVDQRVRCQVRGEMGHCQHDRRADPLALEKVIGPLKSRRDDTD